MVVRYNQTLDSIPFVSHEAPFPIIIFTYDGWVLHRAVDAVYEHV
jgi:hypothetical protein